MDGIVLLAGKGTRLKHITKEGESKHSILINNQPMGWYSTKTLVSLGVKHLIFVVNPGQEGLAKELSKEFNTDYSIALQTYPEGTPQAISIGMKKRKYPKSNFYVIFGDSFFQICKEFKNKVHEVKNPFIVIQHKDPKLLIHSGVVEILSNKILSIEEKPHKPKGSYALRGLFYFDDSFKEKFSKIKKSKRREYEIVDIIKQYLMNNELDYIIYKNFGIDMGTEKGLSELKKYLNK